jgi:pimeloyl-ACP methyl ester carboxylesterase
MNAAMDAAPRTRRVTCASAGGLHRIAYREWGDARNPNVLLCVHALTRSGRDFDRLAQALCGQYRVVCPDMPGRGESDRLAQPSEYQIPTYVADIATLVARLDVEQVDWVGTSMGALIGMAYAALDGSPVRRLVLNEAGPLVTGASLDRIGGYLGRAPAFDDFASLEAYVRAVCAPFGPHSDDEWTILATNVARQDADGTWRLAYDPAIAVPFNATVPHEDVDLWALYDRIRCPTLVIRGAESDLLLRETFEEMQRRGPRARGVEFAGIGHAPTLMHADQIALLREFLLQ